MVIFIAAAAAIPTIAHQVSVDWVPNNHGYPYRADCSCGWSSRTYAATHAAQAMGEDHVEEVQR